MLFTYFGVNYNIVKLKLLHLKLKTHSQLTQSPFTGTDCLFKNIWRLFKTRLHVVHAPNEKDAMTSGLDRKEVRGAIWGVHSTATGWPMATQDVFF